MQRVILIDDDVIVRRGLQRNIAWEEHGLQVVGEAGDGEEGMRLFKALNPSIVISDIKMPFMDGLEFSRQLLELNPRSKIVLITGYEEFDYAKQALQLKVFDLILKPVDNGKLLETLKRAVLDVENDVKLKRQIMESRPLLVQQFLTRLIHGWYPGENEIRDQSIFLEISLNWPQFSVILIKIDEYYNVKFFPGVYEQETAKFKVMDICRDILETGSGYVLDCGGDEIVLICGTDLRPGEAIQSMFELGETIRQTVNGKILIQITIGIGTVRPGITEVAVSYRDAKATTEFRHIYGKNQVLVSGETGLPVESDLSDLRINDEQLILKVRLGMAEDALAILQEAESCLLAHSYVSLSAVRLIGMELAVLCLKELQICEPVVAASDPFFLEQCRLVQEGQTICEIFNSLRQLVEAITGVINRKREAVRAGVVGDAIRFIENNYYQEGLSLTEVAQAVHVTPVYLSMIFKKENGVNFSDFVTEIRLKKAMELLRNSDLKTYEVAEKVGYSNPRYFSACFKRYTGYSPSEFKVQ